MDDFSHWDFAEHFKAKEVAELIAGISPEKNTNLFGVMGEEANYTTRITPILRRMEHAFREASSTLSCAATWDKDAETSLQAFPALPTELQSEMMTRVRGSFTAYGLAQFADGSPHGFEEAYFEREEIHRWLTAIGMKSAYRFGRITEAAPPIPASAPPGVRQDRLDTAFDRAGGDDREELHQWLMMDTWPMEPAMFLIAGVIPTRIYEGFGYFKIEGGILHDQYGEKEARTAAIERFVRLWKSNPQHADSATPEYYFDWAASKKIDIYWLEAAKNAGYFPVHKPPPSEPLSLHPKVQTTLLTIIAILCKEAKLDYKKPAKTAGLIRGMADQMGISIGETTIEGHLKKIPDAVEGRMK